MSAIDNALGVLEDVQHTDGITHTAVCPVHGDDGRRIKITPDEKLQPIYWCDGGCRPALVAEEVTHRLQQHSRTWQEAGAAKNGQEPPTRKATTRPPDVPPHPAETEDEGTFVVPSLSRALSETQQPPKNLADEALYGLAGEVVQTILPFTESSAIALLGSFLVGVGCLIGRSPHVFREAARHGTNEFVCLVGPSSVGRKGTGGRQIDILLNSIDCNWTKNIVRGLSSGEGLISIVRDPRYDMVPVKNRGRHTGEYDEVMVDPGVDDKRKLVIEEEFAQVLKVMRREGNTLSTVIRSAWDNLTLSTATKSNKERATDPHISIIGHVTEDELRSQLSQVDTANGFANRFLWFCTQRSKFLPRGGGKPATAPLVKLLHDVIDHARRMEAIDFDEDAGNLWDAMYPDLTTRPRGLLGAVTGRAEAHVTRLSLMYAVLEASSVIRIPHLLAALAVWDVNEASCRYVFGTATGDDMADQIEEWLEEVHPGYLTRTEIRDKFGRNAAPGRIPKALATLITEGRAEMRLQTQEKGRPCECWSARLNDRTTKVQTSYLEKAKQLLL
jgi:hypothetical protein